MLAPTGGILVYKSLLLMLRIISSFINRPVLSLQTGAQVAATTGVILDPHKLRVAAFTTSSPKDTGTVLMCEDIREVSRLGLLVDHYDKLAHPDDLVRLEPILKLNFKLIGLTVKSESGQKFGKVTDYIVDDQTFYISRLYTKQSIVKNFTGSGMVIDRSQIIEVSRKTVVIRDPVGTMPSPVAAAIPGA